MLKAFKNKARPFRKVGETFYSQIMDRHFNKNQVYPCTVQYVLVAENNCMSVDVLYVSARLTWAL